MTTIKCQNALFIFSLFFFLFLFLGKNICVGQQKQDSLLVNIITKDGNEYIGEIIDEDEQTIHLKTFNIGIITIEKNTIRKRETLVDPKKLKGKEFWFDNPQATRYFFSANGYGLKKGEAYYQNVWVLFNQFAYGITDNISIGGGIVPLFLFAGTSTPVWITPKVSIPIIENSFNIGLGALAGTLIGETDSGFGLLYGSTTFGTRDRNLSLGLGYGYSSGNFADLPTISLSAMIRTGPKGYFITENYFISSGGSNLGILSFGGRRMIKRMSIDYGGFIPLETGENFIILPWLGFTIPFGYKSEK